jgi:hypothetical protein
MQMYFNLYFFFFCFYTLLITSFVSDYAVAEAKFLEGFFFPWLAGRFQYFELSKTGRGWTPTLHEYAYICL